MRLLRTPARPFARLLATIAVAATGLAASALPVGAQSTVLTFEDLAYNAGTGGTILWPGGPIVSSYGGLEWTSFRPLDLANYPLHRPQPDPGATGNAGYPLAPAFGSVLGLAFGDILLRPTNPAVLFELDAGSFGSGWTDGMTLDITGRRGGSTLFSQQVSLSALSTSLLTFPGLPADEVLLHPNFLAPGVTDPYGSAPLNNGVPFQSFWLDNLGVTFSAVPEPGTVALVASGLTLLAAASRRARRRRRS
jgi:hypothetical protein